MDQRSHRSRLFALGEEERRAVELAALQDDRLFEQLEIDEDEMLDAYVRGSLGRTERQAADRMLAASPRLRQRLRIATALRRRSRASRRGDRRWLAPAAAVALMGLGLAWWLPRELELQTGSLVAVSLSPGDIYLPRFSARSAEGVPVFAAPAGEAARLVLEVGPDEPYQRFRLELLGSGGQLLQRWDGLIPQQEATRRVVAAAVPTALLEPGRYILTLEGVGPAGTGELVAHHEMEVATADDR